MASEQIAKNREEMFGDLHFVDEEKDFWNVTLGGDEPYILIRRTPDGKQSVVHYNIPVNMAADKMVECAFGIKEL